MEDKNINIVSGNIFNGQTNIIAGGNNVTEEYENKKEASYIAEPIWRSPITLALLTWLSIILALIEIFPLYKIFKPIVNLFNDKNRFTDAPNTSIYLLMFCIIFILVYFLLCLRKIVKTEKREPLKYNFAIKGKNKKITIEKIKPSDCPICGGKMKYYKKTRKEITKRQPVLECKRNPEHCWSVDPTDN